ncbi:uncharacterized protein MELLADRAFT_103541 [Melampsora larici-populina 98AG31]|uniref:CCHC-type domain-containing protein n=1 Tax=Melampsora larici-populina (strain 98AG31 / pathotype 3-4-7) TaxID=747676 RepID=F4RBP0_MELLP|nr:uncharacterized protein MELLADRAFT_103541 [Melampsora larici-populina 98AG31]EGG10132.1 hypothetical protein MELLADRAFT_103541 [Melampsora larici-populina 98AG31]
MAVRHSPPATRNRGSQHGSPSQRGTSSTRGSRGRGSARLGTESAPPHLPPPPNIPPVNPPENQHHHSPPISSSNLHEQSPPFASNEQTLQHVSADQFTSTPMDHREPPPHPEFNRTYHPQPRRLQPLSFDDFIGQPAISQPPSNTNQITARLDKLDKLAPHVERYISKVPLLENDGSNINNWLDNVNDAIYFMIDKTDYLLKPSNLNHDIHPEVDLAENKLAYRALFYTISPMLHLSQHFESIERLADALERDGFVWTRDSILSIIYQATMPKSPDYDTANVKLDVRWNTDQRPFSSAEVRNALQTAHLKLRREESQLDLNSDFNAMSISAREQWPCNYCKQKGHWIDECPELHNKARRAIKSQNHPTPPSSPFPSRQETKNDRNVNTHDTKSVRFSDASAKPQVTALSIEDFANGDGTFSLDREIPFDPPSVMSYRIDPDDILAAEEAAQARAEESDIPKEYFM